jgi:hypothetical protein
MSLVGFEVAVSMYQRALNRPAIEIGSCQYAMCKHNSEYQCITHEVTSLPILQTMTYGKLWQLASPQRIAVFIQTLKEIFLCNTITH